MVEEDETLHHRHKDDAASAQEHPDGRVDVHEREDEEGGRREVEERWDRKQAVRAHCDCGFGVHLGLRGGRERGNVKEREGMSRRGMGVSRMGSRGGERWVGLQEVGSCDMRGGGEGVVVKGL